MERRIEEKMMNLFSLKGKTAVITGAGGVIFGTVAKGLAELGARIAVLDLREEEAQKTASAIEKSGGEALAVAADVLDRESVDSAYREVLENFGSVDILINGAGGNNPRAITKKEEGVFFHDLSVEGIKFVFDLNILGTVIPSLVFVRKMIEQKEGVIINTSSMSADTPLSRTLAYSSAKAAVSNFTRWLAADLAMNHSPSIRVNEIKPGFFPTLQNADLISKTPGILKKSRGEDILGGTPMGRYGKPEELLGAVVYLCSPSASFTTGASLAVDGGFGAFSGV